MWVFVQLSFQHFSSWKSCARKKNPQLASQNLATLRLWISNNSSFSIPIYFVDSFVSLRYFSGFTFTSNINWIACSLLVDEHQEEIRYSMFFLWANSGFLVFCEMLFIYNVGSDVCLCFCLFSLFIDVNLSWNKLTILFCFKHWSKTFMLRDVSQTFAKTWFIDCTSWFRGFLYLDVWLSSVSTNWLKNSVSSLKKFIHKASKTTKQT